MSYIDSNLIAGERVIYRTRLHWSVFVLPILFIVVILVPFAFWMVASNRQELVWAPVLLAVLILIPPIIRRQSSDFAVTNKRVMMKVGVFTTRSVELLLGKIEAIAVDQTVGGRIFGYGNIVVTGSGGTRESFSQIQGPLEFRKAVQSVSDVSPSATAAT